MRKDPAAKQRAPLGAIASQEAAQKPRHPLKPSPGRAVLWGVPTGPGTDSGAGGQLRHQVGWRFVNANRCPSGLFLGASALQKFLESEESGKHRPWDTAQGNLPRGCKFSKCSCGTAAGAGGERGCPRAGTATGCICYGTHSPIPNLPIGKGKLCTLTPTHVCVRPPPG